MTLRIHRTARWMKHFDGSYGGTGHYVLEYSDVLEYQTPRGHWLPVPIVEDEAPPHPVYAEAKKRGEELAEAFRKEQESSDE